MKIFLLLFSLIHFLNTEIFSLILYYVFAYGEPFKNENLLVKKYLKTHILDTILIPEEK